MLPTDRADAVMLSHVIDAARRPALAAGDPTCKRVGCKCLCVTSALTDTLQSQGPLNAVYTG